MKKHLLTFIAIILVGFTFGQRTVISGPKAVLTDPAVTIAISDISTFSFTATFTKNDECAYYKFISSTDADLDLWMQFFGWTIDEYVANLGWPAYSDTVFHYNDMDPNTTFKILVVAYDAAGTAYPYTYTEVTTGANGGSGTAIIDITVTNITDSSAHIVCTPNEETALFYDGLVKTEFLNEVGLDSVCSILYANTYYPFYTEDAWTWPDLEANTEFTAIAFGQNADGIYGDTTTYTFRTLEHVGILEHNAQPVVLYPMPCNGDFNIAGTDLAGGTAQLFSINGQLLQEILLESDNQRVSSRFAAGTYILRISDKNGKVISAGKVEIR